MSAVPGRVGRLCPAVRHTFSLSLRYPSATVTPRCPTSRPDGRADGDAMRRRENTKSFRRRRTTARRVRRLTNASSPLPVTTTRCHAPLPLRATAAPTDCCANFNGTLLAVNSARKAATVLVNEINNIHHIVEYFRYCQHKITIWWLCSVKRQTKNFK